MKFFLAVFLLASVCLIGGGCMTPQERSGYNPKPFNTPAEWERNPTGMRFQN